MLGLAVAVAGGLLLAPSGARAQGKAGGKGKAGAAMPVFADLGQFMRGLLYVNSNLIFFAQGTDPATVEPGAQSSTATDPLETSYGKWQAVENGALAMAEAANLLMLPGRKCANGRDVPIGNADWPGFVQGLRDAAMESYKLAQTKNLDNMLDAADKIATACANCHDKYRDNAPDLAGRCM
jgi:hypothetical protein